MSIQLPPGAEAVIREKVPRGLQASPEEAIDAAMRLLVADPSAVAPVAATRRPLRVVTAPAPARRPERRAADSLSA